MSIIPTERDKGFNDCSDMYELIIQGLKEENKQLKKDNKRLDSLLLKAIKYGYEIGVEQQKVVNDSNVLLWKNALLTKTNKHER